MKRNIIIILLLINIFCNANEPFIALTNDTLQTLKIDSILKTFKLAKDKTGLNKKINTPQGSENYFFNRTDRSLYLIADYGSKELNLYYYIDGHLAKVIYWERHKKRRNLYYFFQEALFNKKEYDGLQSQDGEKLLKKSKELSSKILNQ